MGIGDVIRAAFGSRSSSLRLTGPPTSSNGASSHHLFWRLPPDGEPVVAVTVDIEVSLTPRSGRLYFWALQASFSSGGFSSGGFSGDGVVGGAGHLGLQHHPAYPSAGAVNWGGYHSAASGRSGELDGSALSMPSALDNPNTGNYVWWPRRPYRYRIAMLEPGVWMGSITDLDEGREVVIRHLHCPGDSLRDVVMWTESFAACDDPATSIVWSSPAVILASGRATAPDGFLVNYQTVADGGCSTSDSSTNDGAVVQRTGVVRSTPGGSILRP